MKSPTKRFPIAKHFLFIETRDAFIERLQKENAKLKADKESLRKTVELMTRHAEGIKKAAAEGVLSLLEL